MDTKDFIKLFKKRRSTVISITLVFVIIGLIITLVQPLKYSSKSRLLILQSNTNTDPYTIARSNEYVGDLISKVIYSGSFLDSLKNSDYLFDRNYFNGNYKENVKKWGKTVFARSGGSTGVIDVEVYHTNPEEAKRISLAINQLIISGQSPYKFNSDITKINVIDEPVVSTFPVKPNIPINLAVSLIFGFLSACSYIYLFPKERVSEKLAKELFGEDNKKKVYLNHTEKIQPVMPSVNNELVPNNLPVYNQITEKQIDQEIKSEFKTNYKFQGNISNVLGE